MYTLNEYSLTPTKSERTEYELVGVSQALSLSKAWKLQTSVSSFTDVLGLRLIPNHTDTTDAVALQLANPIHDVIREAIPLLCSKLSLDLALLKQDRPQLNQPGLLVLDMDSTLIQMECIDELANLAGVGEKVSLVTKEAMQGKLDFAQSLYARVGCLANADQNIMLQVRDAMPLMPGTQLLINKLQQHGWKIAIASGGFSFFADYLKQRLGLDHAKANHLELNQGRLTGKVTGQVVDAKCKADYLLQWATQDHISPQQTVAMGDGANDLLMMECAAMGIAHHAKPIVAAKADGGIRLGGLDTLLYYLN
jgi:phosphoserine phosphatase